MMMDCEEKKEEIKEKKGKEREHRKVAMKINIIPKKFRRLLNFKEGLTFARQYILHYPRRDFDRLVPVTKDDCVRVYVENRLPRLFKESERVSYEKIALDIEEFLRDFKDYLQNIIEKRAEELAPIVHGLKVWITPEDLSREDYKLVVARKICETMKESELLNCSDDVLKFVTNNVKEYLKQKTFSFMYLGIRSIAESLIEHLPKSYKSAMGISEEDSLALQELLTQKLGDRDLTYGICKSLVEEGIKILTDEIRSFVEKKEELVAMAKERIKKRAEELGLSVNVQDDPSAIEKSLAEQLFAKVEVVLENNFFEKLPPSVEWRVSTAKENVVSRCLSYIFQWELKQKPELVARIDLKSFETYCPLCESFVSGSKYLYEEAFPDDYYAYWIANLVKHYRHEHIRYYDRSWRYWYYAEKNPEYQKLGHDGFKILVNNRAKRQLIRAILKDEYLKEECKEKLIEAVLKLQHNDEKTIETVHKALEKLEKSKGKKKRRKQ